jgi:hypothetical protein
MFKDCRVEYGRGLHVTPTLWHSLVGEYSAGFLRPASVHWPLYEDSSSIFFMESREGPTLDNGHGAQGIYAWHVLSWMGCQLSLFLSSLSLLLLFCCYSWMAPKQPWLLCWELTQAWESESQDIVSAATGPWESHFALQGLRLHFPYHCKEMAVSPYLYLQQTPSLMKSVYFDITGSSPSLWSTVHSEIHFPHSA